MYSGNFDYAAPTSLDEALRLLQQDRPDGGEVKVLAGGQSLLPLVKLRLASPSLLVDLRQVPELRGIHDDGDAVVLGAATTYFQTVDSPLVQRRCPLLIQAINQIGDPQVRARGTIGGSLAHADPAGDLPAVALALGATIRATGPGGAREIAADDFFVDTLTTSLQPAEVVTAVRFPATDRPSTGTAYAKHRHPASGYAVVAVAAVVRLAPDHTCAELRLGLTGAATHATRLTNVEQALVAKHLDEAAVSAACAGAADGLDLLSDAYASDEYRGHLASVLAKRAVLQAAAAAHHD